MSSPFRLHRTAIARLLTRCCWRGRVRPRWDLTSCFRALRLRERCGSCGGARCVPARRVRRTCRLRRRSAAAGSFPATCSRAGTDRRSRVITPQRGGCGGPLLKLRIQRGCGVSASVAGGEAERGGAGAKLLRAKRNGQVRRPHRPGRRGRRSRSRRVLPSTRVRAPEIARRRYRLPRIPESGCRRPRTLLRQRSDPSRARCQCSRPRCRKPSNPTASRAVPPSPARDNDLRRRSTTLPPRPSRSRWRASGLQAFAARSHRRTRSRWRQAA